MKRDLTLWATEIVAAVLFLGSMGAFLLYVPLLAKAVVVITLLGLILMFVLGFQAGRGAIRISRARNARRLSLGRAEGALDLWVYLPEPPVERTGVVRHRGTEAA